MKRVNDIVPTNTVRTDEGSPISLIDLAGRALAIFLTAHLSDSEIIGVVRDLSLRTRDFLDLSCSPLLVTAAEVATLDGWRRSSKIPFVMISDPSLALHGQLYGGGGEPATAAWIVDEDSRLVAAVPATENELIVELALETLGRISDAVGDQK